MAGFIGACRKKSFLNHLRKDGDRKLNCLIFAEFWHYGKVFSANSGDLKPGLSPHELHAVVFFKFHVYFSRGPILGKTMKDFTQLPGGKSDGSLFHYFSSNSALNADL